MPGYAIDRMCAGAMTAVTTTAGGIAFGAYDVVIAGGVEHMGHHPMGDGVDPNPRIIAEKLVDPSALVMGSTAENLHDRFPHLTKERADAFAVASQDKLAKAYADGKIAARTWCRWPPASVEQGWGLATADEPPRPGTTMEDLAALKTPFRPHGRVTAGNAAGLNDGATACLLAAEDVAEELGLPVRMRLVTFAFVGVEPEVMGVGPMPATEKALAKAGLTIDDIGLFELNEAFAVQVLAFLDHFGIADDDPRVNEYGGAIAVGHPLASSGVRLMTQLARQFEDHPEVRYGLTAMCIGIGMGGSGDLGEPALERRRREGREVSDMIEFPDEVVTSAPVQLRRPAARCGHRGPDHAGQRLRPHQADDARDRRAWRTSVRRSTQALAPRGRRGRRRDRQAVHLRGRRRPQGDAGGRHAGAGDGLLRAWATTRSASCATPRSRPSPSSTVPSWAAGSSSLCTRSTAPCPPACPPSRSLRSSSA